MKCNDKRFKSLVEKYTKLLEKKKSTFELSERMCKIYGIAICTKVQIEAIGMHKSRTSNQSMQQ